MIDYSTNMMGPVNIEWYRERGLTKVTNKAIESELFAERLGKQVGDEHEFEEITEFWSGGRIDIYGVPGEHHPIEYSLPIMDGLSWNLFSDWLDEIQTQELKTLDELIQSFEQDTGHKIRWASENLDKCE